jgi:hypothetical protein
VVAVPLGQGRRNGPEYATAGSQQESANVMSILGLSEVSGAGGLAWAGNRVRVSATGESVRVSKFEGDFFSREIGNQIDPNTGEELIRIAAPGEYEQ